MKKNILALSSLILSTIVVFNLIDKNEMSYQEISERNQHVVQKSFKGAQQYMLHLNAGSDGTIAIEDVLNSRQAVLNEVRQRNSSSTTLNWTEMGPDNVGGRTRAILIDKFNSSRMFAGGVSGGLWKSTDAGFNWSIVPGTDMLEFSGVTCIVQTNNGDIYFGTGEGSTTGAFNGASNGASGMIGGGIYKSTDNGNSFVQLESTAPSNLISTNFDFAAVVELATNSEGHVYAATSRGLRLSTDGGETWQMAWPQALSFYDVEVASDGSVFASTANKIYYSSTGAAGSFELLPYDGIFNTGSGRIEIEIAPTDDNYIYAIYSNFGSLGRYKGIYRSTDKGQSWETIIPGWNGNTEPTYNIFSEQANYAMALAVSPTDKNKIFIGGLDVWTWKEGEGVEPLSYWAIDGISWYVHADQHEMVFDPNNPDKLYIGNDGGVFLTVDGEEFSPLNRGYGVTQFYTVAFSKEGRVIGGTQDNGTQYVNFENPASDRSAVEVRGGDGGYAQISYIDSDIIFCESQNGAAGRSADNGSSVSSIEGFLGDDLQGQYESANLADAASLFATFINPMELWEAVNEDGSPKDTSMFFAATAAVGNGNSDYCIYMTKEALDFGTVPTWYQVTPAFTSFSPFERIAVSPDGNHILFSRGTNLYRTDNLNLDTVPDTYEYLDHNSDSAVVVTKEFSGSVEEPFNGTITSITFDPNDKNTAVVTVGNYQNIDHIWRSNNILDESPVWVSLQGNLPQMPVYSAVIDVFNSNNIIIGTEFGVWSTTDGTTWTPEDDGMPLVPCHMLRQQTLPGINQGVIYVGTHGRGIFKSDATSNISEIFSNNKEVEQLTIYPNPAESYINVEGNYTDLHIVNLMGKLVLKSTNSKIDISSFEPGTYIVIAKGIDNEKIGKFVKTK